MNIISINDGHNASVALLVDGKIVSAIQEERLTRIKNKFGFPYKSVEWILDSNNLNVRNVDRWVYVSNYIPMNMVEDREERIRAYKRKLSLFGLAKNVAKKLGAKKYITDILKKRRIDILKSYGVEEDKISFMDHHFAHASAAYFGWGNYDEKILILTNDGAGDDVCATVNIGYKGIIERIAEVHMNYSIGELWALMTAMMGMVPLEHEYKIMGLAPYAPKRGEQIVSKIFGECFIFERDGLKWRLKRGVPIIPESYEYFRDKLEFLRFDWIAAGLQSFTEEFLRSWVINCIKKTGIKKIALSGGTFMNVKANKKIMELDEVEDIFVFPSCGDETLVFGGCFYEYFNTTKRTPDKLNHLYLGRVFSNEEIKTSFDNYRFKQKYKMELLNDIESRVAKLLSMGKVVAWFQGREEFGARALGCRSILADPINRNIIKEINEMIKSRDFWMPFAASILDIDEGRFIINKKKIPAPYMIMTFDTTNNHNEIEAAIHPYDLTCRPQIVYEEWNPKYYSLIKRFKSITGRGAILNTSFNLHGLPIVSAPEDAFLVMDESGLNYLAIGDYLIEKIQQ